MQMGLKKEDFQRLIDVVVVKKKLAATLRFESTETCTLVKEEIIHVEGPQVVKESGDSLKNVFKSKKVVTKVKQFHWKMDIRYRIYVYGGNDTSGSGEDSFILKDETISCEIITRGNKEIPARMLNLDAGNPSPVDVSLTWLLKQMDASSLTAAYDIDRSAESCRTPRNNKETMEAETHLNNIEIWCSQVSRYFIAKQKNVNVLKLKDSVTTGLHQDGMDIDSAANASDDVFNPVVPLFETPNAKKSEGDSPLLMLDDDTEEGTKTETTSPILPASDISSFLTEQCRTMEEQIESLTKQSDSLSNDTDFMACNEAILTLLCKHLISIISIWYKSVHYIEDMLLTQLKDAIGKTVKSSDLDDFIRFHNQRIFHEDFAPESFCYSVRRPGFHPEGMLTIENVSDSDDKKDIHQAMTFTRKLETNQTSNPVFIPINAAASVEFRGDMFLHAWIMSKFNQRNQFELVARTRQFSSFMLILGKMIGPDGFEPAHAIILQNKDEIMIPLLMEDLPSAKEFKDAIESLSPEQQRFAKAFRSMQLASSVFGVCIIQLKPQLEALLGLPDKSLTKEIRLTQDLLSLFIDYQIPSDLLTFDGSSDMDATSKLLVVKNHVKSVMDMIKSAREEELKEEAMKADMAYDMFCGAMADEEVVCSVDQVPQQRSAMKRDLPRGRKQKRMSRAAAAPAALAAPPPMRRLFHSNVNSRNQEAQSQEMQENKGGASSSNNEISSSSSTIYSSIDFTNIPEKLNAAFEKFSTDEVYGGVMRTTTLNTGKRWRKSSKPNLLSPIKTQAFNVDDQKREKNKAFDLLDALSRSGSLPIACAELHIIVASTHSFEQSVVDTVVKQNVNPIEKIERSHLLVASLIHDVGLETLLSSTHEFNRIAGHSPLLLEYSSTGGLVDGK